MMATSVAGVLVTLAGPTAAQSPHAHSIPADARFGAGPGTHGTDVYRQGIVDQVFCNVENVECGDDLHLTQAGDLVSFDFTYATFDVGAATSVTAYVNFYDNDPSDSIDPVAGTSTLLGSVVVPGLPERDPLFPSAFFSHTVTVDLATPITLPQDIWMGIRIDLEDGGQDPSDQASSASCADLDSWAGVQFASLSSQPPTLGSSDLPYFVRGNLFNVRFDFNWANTVTLRMDDGGPPPANHAPVCAVSLDDARANFNEPSPGVFVVTEGHTITVPFTGVDQDMENLVVTSTPLPGSATSATLSPTSGLSPLTSTFEWTPIAGDKAGAPYNVVVTFTDAAGASASCPLGIADINLNPVCSASDQTVQCTSSAGASVTLDGSATDPDLDPVSFHWDVSDLSVILDDPNIAAPTGVFPIGVTMATLTVTDGRGGVAHCDVLITVEDTRPPEVMCTTDVTSLWPPNHKMHAVTLVVTATDECAAPGTIVPIQVTVTSNEPDNATGRGDGDTTGDVNGLDGFGGVDVTSLFTYDAGTQEWVGTIQLRAERAGTGEGRKYTIDVSAVDSSNNSATTSCCIVVAHDRRKLN